MRSYFFGDIHGNLDALEGCLKHMDAMKPDAAYCLGDIVGWLPFGDRSLARMKSLGIETVAGNHDLMVAGLFTDHVTQIDRMQATAYNAGLLSSISDAGDYLLGFPLILETKEFVLTHHSPFHLPGEGESVTIDCFNYLDEAALGACLEDWNTSPHGLIFSGHDHVPAVFELPPGLERPTVADVVIHRPPREGSLTVQIAPGSKYWIKAGSVGGPYRDGVPTANSVLFDSERETVSLFRIPYPVENLLRDLSANRFCRNLPTIRRYMDLLAQGEKERRG
jgi:predicted phosphodiesterase